MKEELISFETAKLAKELQFSIGSENFYREYLKDYICPYNFTKHKKGDKIVECGTINVEEDSLIENSYQIEADIEYADISMSTKYEAPTQSLLQKWLREKHNIHLIIVVNELSNKTGSFKYKWYIFRDDRVHEFQGVKPVSNKKSYKTYEQALEAGLLEALKLIKT